MDPKLLRMYSDILNEQGFPQQYALRNTEDPRITAARQQATASTPTPGTAAAVRGARGGTGPVTAPQAARPATPLPGNPNAPAYQKDPSQSKKVGTGASGFGAPQAAKPAATTSTSQNIKAAGAAFQSQQPAQTAPGGGPNNAETLAAKLGQTAPAAKTPDAMAGSDAGDQTSSGYSLQSQAQRSPDNAMAGSQATASQTQTSNYTGQDVRTANARDANAAPPTQGFVGGAAPAATPSPATAAPAGPMSKPTMPATPASPGGPSATTVGGKENTVGTTSGTLQSAAGPVTSGAGIKKDAFGTPQFEEELEEEIDESLEEEQLEEAFNEMLRLSGIQLNEKAVSKQQQKFMGMVHAMQKGEKVKGASPELKKVARDMGKKDAKDFASTKHKGLPQKVSESVVLEAGTNLEHIVTRFKHETKRFLAGDDLDSDLYEALYDYYADAGEMPYGVAKARDGDPYQWVSDHFADELALMGYDRQFQETVIPVVDNQLSELARLAGLSESQVNECGDMGMDTDDRLNVSTNMSSDGTKSVNISAQGEKAEELLAMLKLAGMGGSDRPSMVMIDRDEEMMDEDRPTEYANTSDENINKLETQFIGGDGEVAGKEKRMHAGGSARFSDNPLAVDEMLDEELSALLDSVLVKEEDYDKDMGAKLQAWRYEMLKKGASRFSDRREDDSIIAYDRDGERIGKFSRKGVEEGKRLSSVGQDPYKAYRDDKVKQRMAKGEPESSARRFDTVPGDPGKTFMHPKEMPMVKKKPISPFGQHLVKKEMEEGSIKGGDKPGELTGTWSADPPKKGQPNVPPPVPMDPVYPTKQTQQTPKPTASTPGTKR